MHFSQSQKKEGWDLKERKKAIIKGSIKNKEQQKKKVDKI
jgi:hypothetical protein